VLVSTLDEERPYQNLTAPAAAIATRAVSTGKERKYRATS
jgi:hypothetical protein